MTAATSSNTATVRLVGIDCATQATQVGLAFGMVRARQLFVERVSSHKTWDAIDDEVARYIAEAPDGASLLALDAPLGWPSRMGDALHAHRAGVDFDAEANAIFRRRTDDVVADALGKRPLDVGAERIARTAHSALAFLGRLRRRHGTAIPLAWTQGSLEETSAIEVYPAATLAGRGLRSSGYKGTKTQAWEARQSILDSLGAEAPLDDALRAEALGSDHVLDAVLCLLAARDFVVGEVISPENRELAAREGWIWVRPPPGGALSSSTL